MALLERDQQQYSYLNYSTIGHYIWRREGKRIWFIQTLRRPSTEFSIIDW